MRSIGNIGPLGSQHLRNILYDEDKINFYYKYTTGKKAFTIGLTSLLVLPRHFMNLYYANISEFHSMR